MTRSVTEAKRASAPILPWMTQRQGNGSTGCLKEDVGFWRGGDCPQVCRSITERVLLADEGGGFEGLLTGDQEASCRALRQVIRVISLPRSGVEKYSLWRGRSALFWLKSRCCLRIALASGQGICLKRFPRRGLNGGRDRD
jgi:hypothetical protein